MKNTAQSVIVPLKNCISSLDRVYEALVATDVHPITGHCSSYEYIRQQIVQAWQSMELSDQAATTCLRRLDEVLETLTRDKGILTRQKNTTECTLNGLRTEQDSNQKLLQESQGALKQAETHLNSTKETIQRQQRREETASRVARVGLAVSLIPFFGWVVGKYLGFKIVSCSHICLHPVCVLISPCFCGFPLGTPVSFFIPFLASLSCL